nr:hypothetical protein [Tanacetum cinerariifolium]
MTRLDLFRLKSLWGNINFDYACSMARGRPGGLISIWDPNFFSKEAIWCDDSFIIVKGHWNNEVGDCFIINIYGPQESAAKSSLWNRLAEFMNQHNGKFILFGDFNTVLHEYERSGSLFSRIEAEHFNAFFDSTGLIDLPIGGRHFTWMNKVGTNLSKLDCFLISEGVMEDIPDIKFTAIERLWSDNSPILLHSKKADFGPSPFKLYNSWLSRDGFDDIVKSTWDSMQTGNGSNKISSYVKLKNLKNAIKKWQVDVRKIDRSQKSANLFEIYDIEKKIDDGSASISDQGDKNSKFFHGIINSKRRTQAIAGILHDGVWITELPLIKDVFLNYYKDKFQAHDSQVIFTPIANSLILCHHDRDFLESRISLDEVKNVVWECGSNKAPGSDGFSFAFIKKYWDLMKMDIFEFVNSFFASGSMPQGANSYFFTLIPKISNQLSVKDFCPISLIGTHYKIIFKLLANRLSKVTDKRDHPVVKKEEEKMSIFKVDFEKAFDSVSWKYLDFILDSLGFGSKWRSWIKACLYSSRASILINGTPTFEFSIKRGLRQRDPLSPFLFILVMEGLHCAMSNAVNFGLIRRIKLGSSGIVLSYLTGRAAGCFPFTYLWLPIDANMNLTSSWQILIDRFQKRLSSWKANLLSIGGRLTLIKAGLGSLGIYYLSIFKAPETILNSMESLCSRFFWGGSQDYRNMAWVKWSQVLSSFKKGGLQIGSLKAFNLALLRKWRWRLLSSPNNMIIGTSNFLHSKSIIPLNSFCFKVGCGTRVRFWKDIWIGDSPFDTRYNRLYRLDQDKDCLIIDRIVNGQWRWNWSKSDIGTRNMAYLNDLLLEISQIDISVDEDTCTWVLSNDGTFSVKSARCLIDSKLLPSIPTPTVWDKFLPRKVNIFLWRLSLDRLPHRLNLSSRGHDIPTISCSSCNGNVESADIC